MNGATLARDASSVLSAFASARVVDRTPHHGPSRYGLFGGNFAIFSLWLPELFGTEVRGTAFAFCTWIGRFIGAGVNFADRDRFRRRAAGHPVRARNPRQALARLDRRVRQNRKKQSCLEEIPVTELSRFMSTLLTFRYWHRADAAQAQEDVRFQG